MSRLLKISDLVGKEVNGFTADLKGSVLHWIPKDDTYPIWIMGTPNFPIHGWYEFEMFYFGNGELRTPFRVKMKGDGKDLGRYLEVLDSVIKMANIWKEELSNG